MAACKRRGASVTEEDKTLQVGVSMLEVFHLTGLWGFVPAVESLLKSLSEY